MRVVVVNNMIDIPDPLANPSITAIQFWGNNVPAVKRIYGAATIEVIKQYSFDRAFIGSCGVDMTDCAITTLGVEGRIDKAAVHSSRHKYVVMERDKFYFNDSYKYAYFDDISGIVTDEFQMIRS